MKTSTTLSLALAVGMAFVAGKAVAVNTNAVPVLNINATIDEVKTQYVTLSGNNTIQTTKTVALNNASIMLMVSNALALFPPSNSPAIMVPAKSYLVFIPDGTDAGDVQGYFYVTNKSTGFYFPLSGIDTNGAYYSYAEFDTDLGNVEGFDLGPTSGQTANDDFNSVDAYNQSNVTNTETDVNTATVVFYIHDNAYAYDAADIWAWYNGFGPSYPFISSPNPTGANYEFSLAIKGVVVTKSSTTPKDVSTSSGTVTGTGDALIDGNEAVITSGKATITDIVHVGN